MEIIPLERIASSIYVIRGEKVMVDSDLAALYGVTTSALNQQVKRNAARFPEDFAFLLAAEETRLLKSQIVISRFGGGQTGHGGRRKPPLVFTEQGVARLSSVLRSERAAQVNVAIMRTFFRLREPLLSNRDLARKVDEHDRKITVLFDTLAQLLTVSAAPRKKIGFLSP